MLLPADPLLSTLQAHRCHGSLATDGLPGPTPSSLEIACWCWRRSPLRACVPWALLSGGNTGEKELCSSRLLTWQGSRRRSQTTPS